MTVVGLTAPLLFCFARDSPGTTSWMESDGKRSTVPVFIDIDGTLVDTTYLHTYAWWRALDDAYPTVCPWPSSNLLSVWAAESCCQGS